MTNPNLTEIICIVDRSGSMSTIRQDAIGGFNAFLKEQKKVPKPCRMTYAQFDTHYEIVHNGINLQNMPPLTSETFVPRGGTALLDAIGRTINEVGSRLSALPGSERPGKVIFVILTDGEENSSNEFTPSVIKEMITLQREKYQWEFVFLAANQDAFTTGTLLGVQRNYNFSHSSRGVKGIYGAAGRTVASYRMADTAEACCAALDGMADSVDSPDLAELLQSEPAQADDQDQDHTNS